MSHGPEREPESNQRPLRERRPNAFQALRALLATNKGYGRITEDHVLSVLASRRGREAAFGRELFADPAWDILLELYAARLGRRKLNRCDLAKSVDIPVSSLERWLKALMDRGTIVTNPGRTENELPYVELSSIGETSMKRLMDYWGSAFRSI